MTERAWDGGERRRSHDRELGEIGATLRAIQADLGALKSNTTAEMERIDARLSALEASAQRGRGALWALGLMLPTIGGGVGALLATIFGHGGDAGTAAVPPWR